MKTQKRERIFELLKKIRETKLKTGLPVGMLVVFSDIPNILSKGAHPLGVKKSKFDAFKSECHINSEDAADKMRKIGDDGAILIDKRGIIYSPAVYLNVSLHHIDKEDIHPEYCARHIAALSTSSTSKARVFTLSGETGEIREFSKGKIRRHYPSKEEIKVLETINRDLKKAGVK